MRLDGPLAAALLLGVLAAAPAGAVGSPDGECATLEPGLSTPGAPPAVRLCVGDEETHRSDVGGWACSSYQNALLAAEAHPPWYLSIPATADASGGAAQGESACGPSGSTPTWESAWTRATLAASSGVAGAAGGAVGIDADQQHSQACPPGPCNGYERTHVFVGGGAHALGLGAGAAAAYQRDAASSGWCQAFVGVRIDPLLPSTPRAIPPACAIPHPALREVAPFPALPNPFII